MKKEDALTIRYNFSMMLVFRPKIKTTNLPTEYAQSIKILEKCLSNKKLYEGKSRLYYKINLCFSAGSCVAPSGFRHWSRHSGNLFQPEVPHKQEDVVFMSGSDEWGIPSQSHFIPSLLGSQREQNWLFYSWIGKSASLGHSDGTILCVCSLLFGKYCGNNGLWFLVIGVEGWNLQPLMRRTEQNLQEEETLVVFFLSDAHSNISANIKKKKSLKQTNQNHF